jgi:hypothetical protein
MAEPQSPRKCYVSGVRRRMDGQEWLRIIDETGWEHAYVPFGDRTKEEYQRCYRDAQCIAEALTED